MVAPPSYNSLYRATAASVLVFTLGYLLYLGGFILAPLATSFLISVLLLPLSRRLERWGFPRTLASLICILLVVAIMGSLVWFFMTQAIGLESQLPALQRRSQALMHEFQHWIFRTFHVTNNQQIRYVENMGKNFAEQGGEIFSRVTGFTGDFVTVLGLMPIYIFFILYYRTFFMLFLSKLFAEQRKDTVFKVATDIEKVSQNYLLGLLTVILIVGMMQSVGLYFLGIENPIFFGMLAAVLAVIPYIGIMIGSILPAVVALVTKDSAWYAVGVIAVMQGIQFLESNFITPFIVGGRVSVNQLAALLALLIGGSLWGVIGMVLAIPFTAIIKVIFDNVEGLEPWGYLLGDAPPLPKREKNKKS